MAVEEQERIRRARDPAYLRQGGCQQITDYFSSKLQTVSAGAMYNGTTTETDFVSDSMVRRLAYGGACDIALISYDHNLVYVFPTTHHQHEFAFVTSCFGWDSARPIAPVRRRI